MLQRHSRCGHDQPQYFAAMPSSAKAVFCHIGESPKIWIYQISLGILEYPLSWAAPPAATPGQFDHI